MACGHCIIGVICRVLRLGSCEFSSVEEDELAIFLLPMPVSLPGERLECTLRFGRFPSRLKLSAASI